MAASNRNGWRDHVGIRTRELVRQRAAAFLRAQEAAEASASAIRVDAAPAAFVPREGDRTLVELIDTFKAEREKAHGPESTERKYHHIWAALTLALGSDKPIRAITREDCRKVRDLLRIIPAHMGKRYPGLTMADAIDQAAEDGADLLAPNTVNSYMSNLIAVMNFALKEDWIVRNPASGLVDKNLPTVRRRGFEPSELESVFGALGDERKQDGWRFWVPALALYTGARLNEICQLRTEDVQVAEDFHYIRISIFDSAGRLVKGNSLKNEESDRNVPLHPDLIAAGFLEFVQRQGKSDRLFGELKPGPYGGFSRDMSRWFGPFMDRIGLSDPALVAHSFRHGFRNACDLAGIHPDLRKAAGGWANGGVADRYGRRDQVPVLAREISKIRFGDFRLPGTSASGAVGAN